MNPDTSNIERLIRIMSLLRNPDHGCPWDLQQDFRSIAPHTLEEVYEVVDAIENDDFEQLKGELGDLLFQVVFYAQLGRERQLFDFDAVAGEVSAKLLQRHPHVFPDATLESFGKPGGLSPAQVETNWERLKTRERQEKSRGDASLLDDVPLALPALTRARKLQKRVAGAGFDWPDAEGVLAKLKEEIVELEDALRTGEAAAVAEELGDLLFSAVNLARHLRQEPESALRAANRKFEARFRAMEALAREEGRELAAMNLEELEGYWQRVKKDSAS